ALGSGSNSVRARVRRGGERRRRGRLCCRARRSRGARTRLRPEPGAARDAGGVGARGRGARRARSARRCTGREADGWGSGWRGGGRRPRARCGGAHPHRERRADDRRPCRDRRRPGEGGMSEGQLALVGRDVEGLPGRAEQAIGRATQYLLVTQHARGYWHAPLEANVTMEAEYVFFNRLLGRAKPDLDRRMAERLVALQQADGSWPLYAGGPGNISTTIEAYFALRLVGLPPAEPALARARDFILAQGGLARAGVFTRIWLAYFGQFPWAGVPAMPVELVLLP